MTKFLNKSILNLAAAVLFPLLLAGCASHIRPKPEFSWPDMADSKIAGKLAVFISPETAKTIVKSDPSAEFHHNDLLIGSGAVKLTEEVCLAVFAQAEIFNKRPGDEFLKNAGYRGLLSLDSITTNITLPTKSGQNDSSALSDMSIRLGLNYSAVDFLIKQDIPPSFGPDGQYGKKMKPDDLKNINKGLKELTNRILKESGTNLAQSLVNIFGARP
jgi:hypothetical protein